MLLSKSSQQSYDKLTDKDWIKCKNCGHVISKFELTSIKECPNCNEYFRMNVEERMGILLDKGTFHSIDIEMDTDNVITFPKYSAKIKDLKKIKKDNEAIEIGEAKINGYSVAVGIMNSEFIMGTLNRVVGERIIQLIRVARKKKIPLLLVTSSGGARMQEGIFSLVQMARIQNELNFLSNDKIPYISLMTDPTMGGVTASFATTADIVLGEKGAMIGFAGPRVIKKVSTEELPDGFQTSETMLKNGFIDIVVKRESEKRLIGQLFKLLDGEKSNETT